MPRYATLFDRLVAHVEIDGLCWTWTGPTRHHGGGDRPAISVHVPGKGTRNFNAARVMCEQIHGPAPDTETVRHEASHLCHSNWLCVNPDHLMWETKRQNIARRGKHHEDQEPDPRHDPDLFERGVTVTTELAPF